MAVQSITTRTAPFVQTAPLLNLPVELVQKVLGHVPDIQAILACGQTCKAWNILMQQDQKSFQCFWKYLTQRDFSQEPTPVVDYQEEYKKHHGIYSNLIKDQCDQHCLEGHTRIVSSFLFVEGKLISGSWDNTIKIWDLEKNICLHTLEGHRKPVRSLLFADGKLFSSSRDKTIKIWDLKTHTCLHTLRGHTDTVVCLLFAQGKLISGSYDETIKIWDLETNECVHTLEGHSDGVIDLLSVNGNLISGSWDKSIRIWDLESNACLHILWQKGGVTCLLFAEGKLISGSMDYKINIWDLKTHTCLHCLEGHAEKITCLLIAEGKLLSCSWDNTIKIWDLKTNTCIHTLKQDADWMTSPLFIEGKLIANSAATTIKIWDFNPKLELTVRFDAKYGNSLVLCGEGGELSWNPPEGKPLKCEGKDRWTISIPKGAREFKLVWRKKDGSYVWERGRNRTPGHMSSMLIENPKF